MDAIKKQRSPIKPRYVRGLAVLIIFVGGLALVFIHNPTAKMIFSDVFIALVDLVAAGLLSYAAYKTRKVSRRLGIAWTLIAVAQLMTALGDITWAIFEVILHKSPFPSIADFFYLAFYPTFMLGAFFLGSQLQTRLEWNKRILDMGIVLIAAFLGFWNFLIGPLALSTSQDSILVQVLTTAYPVGDVVMVAVILWLTNSNQSRPLRRPITLMVISAFITIITDSIYSFQTLQGTYQSGGLLDLGWLVSSVLYGMAGYYQVRKIITSGERQRLELPLPAVDNPWRSVITYAPYIWLTIAYSLLIYNRFLSLPSNYLLIYIGVGLTIALVVVRQIITLQENRSLYLHVEKILNEVQRQAISLEKTNYDLQTEINERLRIEEQLSYDSLHDSLTDLPNRVLFRDRLAGAIEISKTHPGHTFSVVFMDIDQFKVVNDSLGHSSGDLLLVDFSTRLKKCLRDSDTAARLGGDEFLLLLENTSSHEAISQVVKRIQDETQKEIDINGHHILVTTSMGIVLDVASYENPDEVLRDADIAMYRAKENGRARFEIFDEKFRTQAFSRMEIEGDLRVAFERNEFELFFQPIVNFTDYSVHSLEVLLRWNHPRYGLLIPDDFIPIAEESGLIIQIGQSVLNKSCAQLKYWQTHYPQFRNLPIHVNISSKQLFHPAFANQVKLALENANLAPRFLSLEITENVFINNLASAAAKIYELSSIGVHLEIDDFGTGYSSLSYIHHFTVQAIKIDKSFVHELGLKQNTYELIHTINSMAHKLGMETIAEGIETELQLAEVKISGCNLGQGYLFSAPVNRSGVEVLLNNPYIFSARFLEERKIEKITARI